MNIEFHYYMTYLVATKAGIGRDEARVIAFAAQHIDDNSFVVNVEADDGSGAAVYQNYVSQTMDILKAKRQLFRIYPIFHFIPGDPRSPTAWRKDGSMHWLNTTPNSTNANRVFDAALTSGDLYRIGVSCHGYADTWAHQNFVGYFHPFNAVSENALSTFTPNVGHADAGHHPDWPALVWEDPRLVNANAMIDNRSRFLEAADHMLRKLAKLADSKISDKALDTKASELRQDLNTAIGDQDNTNKMRAERIGRYRELAATKAYGSEMLSDYDENEWFAQAINEKVRGLRDRDSEWSRLTVLKDRYTWRNPDSYRQSHWYRFQEAVKAHQDETWGILKESTFNGLALPELADW